MQLPDFKVAHLLFSLDPQPTQPPTNTPASSPKASSSLAPLQGVSPHKREVGRLCKANVGFQEGVMRLLVLPWLLFIHRPLEPVFRCQSVEPGACEAEVPVQVFICCRSTNSSGRTAEQQAQCCSTTPTGQHCSKRALEVGHIQTPPCANTQTCCKVSPNAHTTRAPLSLLCPQTNTQLLPATVSGLKAVPNTNPS